VGLKAKPIDLSAEDVIMLKKLIGQAMAREILNDKK
jgi:predicted RNA-binding protein